MYDYVMMIQDRQK